MKNVFSEEVVFGQDKDKYVVITSNSKKRLKEMVPTGSKIIKEEKDLLYYLDSDSSKQACYQSYDKYNIKLLIKDGKYVQGKYSCILLASDEEIEEFEKLISIVNDKELKELKKWHMRWDIAKVELGMRDIF